MAQPPSQAFQHKVAEQAQSTPPSNIFTSQTLNANNIFTQNRNAPQSNPVNIFSQQKQNSGGQQQSGEKEVKKGEGPKSLGEQWVNNMRKEAEGSISGRTEVKTADG